MPDRLSPCPPQSPRFWFLRLFAALLWAAGLVPSWSPAIAETLHVGRELCHAVTPDNAPAPDRYRCGGLPAGYARGTLWLRADLTRDAGTDQGITLLVHQTRFEQMAVLFRYADGHVRRQEVRRGDYGARWRIGGQIAFEAPEHPARLTSVTMGFAHLSSHRLLRIRLLAPVEANRDLAGAAVLTGGSLILLLAGGIYNLALSAAVRRQFLAWHGQWAVCVFVWGLLWSQAALIVVPGVAGTPASQISTFLACLAVGLATGSAITALKAVLPRWAQRGVFTLATLVVLLGIPVAVSRGPGLDLLGDILSVLTLLVLAAVAACMTYAWRRGSEQARDLIKTWIVPMAALALTMVVDLDTWLFGGGSQIVVLFASALQSIWLSIAETRRLAHLRVELDAARAAERALAELANRDPLTGLLNRRGFVARLDQLCAGAPHTPLGLLLIDVDLFKSINDRFGHEVGDSVLRCMAAYLRKLDEEGCFTARMGGEEFAVAVPRLSSAALERFAERVRGGMAQCDHGDVSKHRTVTVSIGVAQGSTTTAFQKLYAGADRALYDAKRGGRDRVVFPAPGESGGSRQLMERDQMAFPWVDAAS